MTVATTNLDELRRALPAERLRTEADATEVFCIDGLAPAAVAEPAEVAELVEIVNWARSRGAALLPATTGTYLPLGNPPRAIDVAVSLARFKRILYYDPEDLTLGVEPGLALAEVQTLLARDGLFLPADPPYADRAALGGLLAANACGPLRYGYGGWRDFVVGLKFVTGDGKLVKTGGRVVKNVAGYDLSKLLIGSLGSLGIITEINFKVFPQPPETATFLAGFADLDRALAARLRVVHSPWQPRRLELFDQQAARLATLKLPADAPWWLAVSVGGAGKVIQRYETDLNALARELSAGSFAVLRGSEEVALWAGLNNLVAKLRAANPNATVVKCPLPLTQLGPFLEKALPVAQRYKLTAAVTAHAGTAVAYVHLLPPEVEDAPRRLAQAATEMIHAGNNSGGRVTIPWCPTAVKRDVNVWGPLRDDFPLMQKLKAQFDPEKIFNRGRFVGGL